jgi:two-component system CheB/CheR fusion protein
MKKQTNNAVNRNLFERRYLPLIIVLIFISISAIAFYTCYRHHTINTEQTLQKDRSTARLLALLMDERLKKIVSAMESYSNRPLLIRAAKDKNAGKASEHLRSLTKHYPDIDRLIITDRQGTLWAAYPERPEVLGKSFAYQDWYKEVSKEWKSNISDVVLRVVTEKDIAFQISVPIFDETGQVIGILLSTQRTVGLSSLTKYVPLNPGTFITITDRKGQIAYSSRHNVEKEIRPYPFYFNIKKAMTENNKTFAVDDPVLGGRINYISFAPVGDIGWTVLIERDKRNILLSEYVYFVQVTAIAFLLFLFIILFAVYSRKQSLIVSEFAESIINAVREPLIALDQNLRVVKVSNSFYKFFKVKPEDTLGQLIYDLGNKQWDIPKLRELLENILPQKVSFDNYEVEHEFVVIGRRIMLLNARQIQRVLGKEKIILLAIDDITERKEIERRLKKSYEDLKELTIELKRANQAKTEFLANMSHELRTPLNSIIGFSEVLYDETFGPVNEKQKKYVNNVLTSGKHLLLLINQILDMAKVEAGKMKLTISDLSMKSLLNDIVMLVADMVSKKKLEISLKIDADLPYIEADELKVKEIIYNLLSNAVKFTPEGGKLGLRAKRIDAEIEIVIWDKGIGIAPENMEKIFEGFFRVDTPFSRVTEGTGLGLPLSRNLVELHGGKLSVESPGLNKGTLVRFTLPIVSPKGDVK